MVLLPFFSLGIPDHENHPFSIFPSYITIAFKSIDLLYDVRIIKHANYLNI